jgi:predicted signal transduction protein with EAL and GGDEF domain
MGDLTRSLAPGSPERVLVIFRLHGLRRLTERHGTFARDELLVEAHRRLAAEIGTAGLSYQPRYDEWCVLFDCPLEAAVQVLGSATAALDTLGEPHDVSAEAGVALLPDEAADPISALEQADRRILPAGSSERERRFSARTGRRGEDHALRNDGHPMTEQGMTEQGPSIRRQNQPVRAVR